MYRLRNTLLVAAVGLSFTIANAADYISETKSKYCADSRVSIWEVKADTVGSDIILRGKTDNSTAKQYLLSKYKETASNVVDSIKMLPDASLPGQWAFTIIPYAHLRTHPGHGEELTSQSLMGNPLKVLEKKGDWYRVQTPDNYIAWVIGNSIKFVSDSEFDKWRNADRYIVTDIYTYLYQKPNVSSDIVSDLVLGNILVGVRSGLYVRLSTPDGRVGYVEASSVQPLNQWAQQEFDANKIVNVAKRLMGSTYTWGGTSTKGVDCSGLTKTAYFSNGVILQRDASQQVLYGEKIKPENWKDAQKGDLLYFGTRSGKVTHTAIYMNDGLYIHASGRVKVNSVDPDSKSYLTTPFLSINRIVGNVDQSDGIKSVKNHKWYFNK